MAERTLQEIFREQAELEAWLDRKHPWVQILTNWIILCLVIALGISFIIWGLDIRARHMADRMASEMFAAMDEEHAEMMAAAEAQEAERKASMEYIIDQEATAVAKAFWGIDKFVEKYRYSESDLETYARCMFNRAENGNLIDEISKPEQFVGYNEQNQVIANYKQLAVKLVTEWHNETVKPCDTSFVFAELTPSGIFLKQDLHADGYARRWHA